MKHKSFAILLLFIGSISFLIGSYGLYRLYNQSDKMIHTTGVVTHLDVESKRMGSRRKYRYIRTARIEYKTDLYQTHVTKKLNNPFIYQGDEIAVWYDPNYTENAIIPFDEGFLWGILDVFGVFCLSVGVIVIKSKKSTDNATQITTLQS